MAFYGNVHRKVKNKLTKYWKQSGGDRDKFKELVINDKNLKGTWSSYDVMARRMNLKGYKGYKAQGRYTFAQLKPEDLDKISRILTEEGSEAARRKYSQFTAEQFRSFAKARGVKIFRPKPIEVETTELSEKSLIEKVEKNEIEPQEFLSQLPAGSELKTYWEVIYSLLVTKRSIRNTDLLPFVKTLKVQAKKNVHRLNAIRGILAKYVEWGVLSQIKSNSHNIYLCNLPDFYEPEELDSILSRKEKEFVLNLCTSEAKPFSWFASQTEKVLGKNLLRTVLVFYVNKNVIDQREEEDAKKIEITSVNDLEKLAAEDLFSKTIKPVAVETDPKRDSL